MDEDMSRTHLEAILKRSLLDYEPNGDEWVARWSGVDVSVSQIGDLVRASGRTNVVATEDNVLALRALAASYECCIPTYASFDIQVGKEVTLYCDRAIGSSVSPDRMVISLASLVEFLSADFYEAARGESIFEIVTRLF